VAIARVAQGQSLRMESLDDWKSFWLELHNFENELDLSNLTKLLDQCIQKAMHDDLHREVKVHHLQALLTDHRRAFEYRITILSRSRQGL
jgi:hypothetical protein